MFDAGDAVDETSADATRPFSGNQQWRANLKSNLESPPDLLQIGGKPVLRELRRKQRSHQVGVATIGLADFDYGHVTYALHRVPVTGDRSTTLRPPGCPLTPRSRIASPGP